MKKTLIIIMVVAMGCIHLSSGATIMKGRHKRSCGGGGGRGGSSGTVVIGGGSDGGGSSGTVVIDGGSDGGTTAPMTYVHIGCFGDTSDRAIETLEGTDSRLDGSYTARADAIRKCAQVASDRGFTMFAVQNGGWCASSATAASTFSKYGMSGACNSDGEGGPWANDVYILEEDTGYERVGCFGDTSNRAIPTLEGSDARLDGSYTSRVDAIEKCAEVAKDLGYKMFGVQNGGWCASSDTAHTTFDKYGSSSACLSDGEGGPWANEVYVLRDKDTSYPVPAEYVHVGCYKDTSDRAIPTLEGTDARLDGKYQSRKHSIDKCAQVARDRGFKMFAVQNGGWCASGGSALYTFDKYGASTDCAADGEGGPWANDVYILKDKEYARLGCFGDTSDRAIPTLENTDSRLDGSYGSRANSIDKCAEVSSDNGFNIFGVQNGGWCASSATALATYNKYGTSDACGADGEGGPWANDVYIHIRRGYSQVGCFKDTSTRAIATLEGTDDRLDGSYTTRTNPLQKCAAVAREQGFQMFALQNGGWCAGSSTATSTFGTYGDSLDCKSDGEGGPWANEVYVFTYNSEYSRIGCFGDTSDRAIPTLEGTDDRLDGSYQNRADAIGKCAAVSGDHGYSIFGVQNGGWCASGASAVETFSKYDVSTACKTDREGGPWANDVFIFTNTPGYVRVGCYKDTSDRAIATLEGTDSRLDGAYTARTNAIQKCADVVVDRGFQMFALQNGGWCASSSDAVETFGKYGASTACADDGEGGPWANEVYIYTTDKEYTRLGCFGDTSDRAIPTLEGTDDRLDGSYGSRAYPIEKCAQAARARGFKMFGVQNGGWCASSENAEETYTKYGTSTACKSDGEGGPWANDVYILLDN
uniref:Uncharacterized protein LOC100374260 n=1 Tax=Saccoglossus kowalevskii TaxID=10224 RepID=A0ABM0GKP2_SACKO|nr:PREDICTED: uncharacterized protein LOC100374260 [Saccoglossus kowalevskii]